MTMFFEDFQLGRSFDIPQVTINEEQVLAFAEEYDPLPIHLDKEYAAASRFEQLLAPGIMTFMKVWAEFVRMQVWSENLVAGLSSKIEWLAPVFIGDILHGKAWVSDRCRRNAYNGMIEFTVDIYNQDDEKVIIDTTQMVVNAREVWADFKADSQ
jgi:3-hydroxybutyryl-CoA dehydratase